MADARAETSSRTPGKAAETIAFILVCLNLRIVYGGVGPLLSYMALDPLAALPPLCMGFLAPFGLVFARRFGEERALFISILLLTIGVLIRSSGGATGLLAGTVIASIALSIVGILGVLLAPAVSGPLRTLILGTGMGAGLAIPGVLFARRTADRHHMAQLSGMVQMFGYPIAATGPVIAAALHGWSGGWTWPLAFVLALLILNGFIGLRGGRDHVIGGEGV